MKDKKKFLVVSFIVFILVNFLLFILKANWLAYAANFIIAAVIVFIRLRQKSGWIRSFIAICLMLIVGFISLYFGRPDRSISFQGNLLNSVIGFQTLYLQHKTPEEMAASVTYSPYQYGSWKTPKGYTDEQIQLENCYGYLLKKDDGTHDRVVYQIHGGAYVMGYGTQYDQNALLLSKAYNDSDVFSIDYRTAAAAPYPAALDDAIDGYEWLLEQGYTPENIVIAGDSAGGGLSIAMTLKLRDDGTELPRALVLASPWCDLTQTGETYTTNRKNDASFGSLDDNAIGHNALPVSYAEGSDMTDPYISPVFADFHDMPPMLIQVGDTEMLLSDSETVAEKAKAAGCEVELKIYPGMWHTFYTMMEQCREQKEAWQTIKDFINK